ncbi:MAG: TPR repeat protein [Cocleimonas sp.]|jgi:TPR repeat protein
MEGMFMNIKDIKTDIDLSESFKNPVFEDYSDAIDFMTIKPDYSLLKFRDIITILCEKIADKYGINFESNKLVEQIDYLHDCQVIHGSFKSTLHELRQLCNTGTHKPALQPDQESSDGNNNATKSIHDTLLDNAMNARKLILIVFEDTFIALKMGAEAPKYALVKAEGQESKEILWQAATTLDWKMKLKAGLIYGSLADRSGMSFPLLISNELNFHHKSLYVLAANFYETAFKMSADTDRNCRPINFLEKSLTEDEAVEKYSDLNALYHYAALASDGILGDEKKERGYHLLKIAADRGHALASAEFGSYQYTEFKDYDLAIQYLNKAANCDDGLAYCWLYFYYSDGIACDVDSSLALDYLNKSLELDCKLAYKAMGEAYHKGELVEKNDIKAEQYLLEGMAKGCPNAKHYYQVYFNDLAGKMAAYFQSTSKAMLEEHAHLIKAIDNKPKPILSNKIQRNETCPCGSGKKYKKCCMVINNNATVVTDTKTKNIFETGY